MILPITTLYAGVFGLALIGLAVPVVVKRLRLRVGLGAGEHIGLKRTMRVHQNFAEYVPMALLLLLIAELNDASAGVLHASGSTLIVARALHAFGLGRYGGISFGRTWGTALTWLVIIGLALGNLYSLL